MFISYDNIIIDYKFKPYQLKLYDNYYSRILFLFSNEESHLGLILKKLQSTCQYSQAIVILLDVVEQAKNLACHGDSDEFAQGFRMGLFSHVFVKVIMAPGHLP